MWTLKFYLISDPLEDKFSKLYVQIYNWGLSGNVKLFLTN